MYVKNCDDERITPFYLLNDISLHSLDMERTESNFLKLSPHTIRARAHMHARIARAVTPTLNLEIDGLEKVPRRNERIKRLERSLSKNLILDPESLYAPDN